VADVIGPGEGRATFMARGSVMYVKALAEQDDGDLAWPAVIAAGPRP
jgi:hypothetical protein